MDRDEVICVVHCVLNLAPADLQRFIFKCVICPEMPKIVSFKEETVK